MYSVEYEKFEIVLWIIKIYRNQSEKNIQESERIPNKEIQRHVLILNLGWLDGFTGS